MSGEELKLLDTARRNIRTFINGATFKCRADQEAAMACVDVLESHIQDQSNLIAILRDVVAIDAHSPMSELQRMGQGSGRLQSLQDAFYNCRRVREETVFADEVSDEYRQAFKAGAQACEVGINMLMQAPSLPAAPSSESKL